MQSATATSEHEALATVNGVPADTADWLQGGSQWSDNSTMKVAATTKDADPFGDQDFFTGLETSIPNGTQDSGSLFEGLTVGGGEESTITRKAQAPMDSLVDLFGGLSTETPAQSSGASVDPFANEMDKSNVAQPLASGNVLNQGIGSGKAKLSQTGLPPQSMMYMNPAVLMQMANVLPQGMNPMLAQQQLAASIANLQNLQNLQRMGNLGLNLSAGGSFQGNGTGPANNLDHMYTDGFDFSTTAAPRYSVEAKKEDTKAFDFLKVNDTNLHLYCGYVW